MSAIGNRSASGDLIWYPPITASADAMNQDRTRAFAETAPLLPETRDTQSLFGLLHRLTAELSTLFHQEVSLAAAEISRSLTTVLLSFASIASGGAVLYAGFILLLFSAICGLAQVLPLWLASASVGLVVTAVGAVLMIFGRQKLAAADLAPTRSTDSLRRDKRVLTGNGP
jgi:Putative Actinobacterial Holin-X, holin superfamily III